jgi:putative transcriptional regulator
MGSFGKDLVQSLGEALAHAKGKGPATVHARLDPSVVRKHAKLTQVQMAPLMGMGVSGYRKWDQGKRSIGGSATALLRIIEMKPEVVKRVLVSNSGGGGFAGDAKALKDFR